MYCTPHPYSSWPLFLCTHFVEKKNQCLQIKYQNGSRNCKKFSRLISNPFLSPKKRNKKYFLKKVDNEIIFKIKFCASWEFSFPCVGWPPGGPAGCVASGGGVGKTLFRNAHIQTVSCLQKPGTFSQDFLATSMWPPNFELDVPSFFFKFKHFCLFSVWQNYRQCCDGTFVASLDQEPERLSGSGSNSGSEPGLFFRH